MLECPLSALCLLFPLIKYGIENYTIIKKYNNIAYK